MSENTNINKNQADKPAKTFKEKLIACIPGIIRNDFPRKLIAFSFALLVFFTVVDKIGIESVVDNVSVSVKTPASLVLLDDKVPKVRLKVKGSDRRLKQISPSNFKIEVTVDESKYIPGEPYTLTILPSNVMTTIEGMKITDIEPSQLRIDLDRNVSRSITIKPKFNPGAKLPEGYAIGKVNLNPPECRLTGPSSIVERMESLYTEPIPVDNTTSESFEYKTALAFNHSAVKITPSSVIAQVEVIKESENRLFRSVPIRVLMPPEDKNLSAELITAPNVDVTVSGLKTIIEVMNKDEIKAYIDLSQFEQPGVYSADIGCWLDRQGVTAKNIFPPNVQVKLTRKR